MPETNNVENLYSLVINHVTYLHNVFKQYAILVHDEGFRKFLNSMASQEEANVELIKEHKKDLHTYPAQVSGIQGLLSRIDELAMPIEDLKKFSRVDFLIFTLEIENATVDLYKGCESHCAHEGLLEFVHSLSEDEKRHAALIKDRLELEQLW